MEKLYPDLMIDLETLGNTNNSAIVQIGACYFDRNTGEIGEQFYCNIEVEDACKYGEMTASTVLWWLQQSQEAQESVFGIHIPRVGLKFALESFSRRMVEGVSRIWCHTDFDWPILQNAYKAIGLEFPFHWSIRRDLRTIADEAGINPHRDYENNGIAHNALDDCKFQVKYTVDCLKKLGIK